jgi:hypothetical protein
MHRNWYSLGKTGSLGIQPPSGRETALSRIRLSLVPAAALLVLATAACSAAEASTATPTTPAAASTTAAATPAAPASGSPAPSGELPSVATTGITLRVTGPGAAGAHVSYTVDTAETTDKDASVPWQKVVDPAGKVTSVSLIAMSEETKELTCEIYLDGEQVETNTANAASAGVANCEWTGA